MTRARDVLVVVGAGRMGSAVAERLGAGRTVLLGDRDERALAAAERLHGLRDTVPVGASMTMLAGSAAQVLLAWDEPERLSLELQQARFDAATLSAVRRRGWAQSVAQREAGVASVSAPVLARDGALLAAVSVSGPIERLGRTPGQRLAPILMSASRRITAALAG